MCTPFLLLPGESSALYLLQSSTCFKWRLAGQKGAAISIGYPRCGHNAIVCWNPGTCARTSSVQSPIVSGILFWTTVWWVCHAHSSDRKKNSLSGYENSDLHSSACHGHAARALNCSWLERAKLDLWNNSKNLRLVTTTPCLVLPTN